MPDLSNDLFALFAEISKKYTASSTKVEKFKRENPILGNVASFFSNRFKSEVDLGAKKREEFKKLSAIFEQEFLPSEGELESLCLSPALSDVRPPSRASNLSTFSLRPVVEAGDIYGTPQTAYYEKRVIRKHNLKNIVDSIQNEIETIRALRAQHAVGSKEHPAGQAEGILEAMRKSIFCLMRIYTRRGVYLVENIDTISRDSDPILQYVRNVAFFSCIFAYDLELARYSRDPKGHKIDDMYYLGSGARDLSIEQGEALLIDLHAKIQILTINFNVRIFFDKFINKQQVDPLYLKKLQRIISKEQKFINDLCTAIVNNTPTPIGRTYLTDRQCALIRIISNETQICEHSLRAEFGETIILCDYILKSIQKTLHELHIAPELEKLKQFDSTYFEDMMLSPLLLAMKTKHTSDVEAQVESKVDTAIQGANGNEIVQRIENTVAKLSQEITMEQNHASEPQLLQDEMDLLDLEEFSVSTVSEDPEATTALLYEVEPEVTILSKYSNSSLQTSAFTPLLAHITHEQSFKGYVNIPFRLSISESPRAALSLSNRHTEEKLDLSLDTIGAPKKVLNAE